MIRPWPVPGVFAPSSPVSITILAGSARRGLNPKVRLLDFMARHARFDTLLVSDSNVRPGPSYLAAIVREQAGGDNAMVSCLVAGVGENSAGAAMENLHLNTYVAPSIALTDAAGHACVIGKSMLFRRSDLARLGGFEPVRDVLAEDYLLGRAFQRAGGRITLSSQVAPVFNQRRTVREFVGRHLRWCQMRFRVSPVTYLLELLLNPTPAWLALALVGPALLGAAGIAAKVLADAALSRRLTGRWNHPRALLLVPVKDLLLFAVWLAAMFRRRIQWRGNALLMGWGSKLSRLPAPPWCPIRALPRSRLDAGTSSHRWPSQWKRPPLALPCCWPRLKWATATFAPPSRWPSSSARRLSASTAPPWPTRRKSSSGGGCAGPMRGCRGSPSCQRWVLRCAHCSRA